MNNLLVKISDTNRNIAEHELTNNIKCFMSLPFVNKLFFVRTPGREGCIYYPELNDEREYEKWKYMKYIDIVFYLNNMKTENPNY